VTLSPTPRVRCYLSGRCQGHPRLLQTSLPPIRVPLLETTSCLRTGSSQTGHVVPVRSPDLPARCTLSCAILFIWLPWLRGALPSHRYRTPLEDACCWREHLPRPSRHGRLAGLATNHAPQTISHPVGPRPRTKGRRLDDPGRRTTDQRSRNTTSTTTTRIPTIRAGMFPLSPVEVACASATGAFSGPRNTTRSG
jgi:hypothetical protein